MRLDDQAERIAAKAACIQRELPSRLHAMRDAMGGLPGAQHFEPVRSGSTEVWCWTHDRRLGDCTGADPDCDPETIELHDPAGEAAVAAAMGADPARNAHRRFSSRLAAAERALDDAQRTLDEYADRKPTIDRDGIGECTDCHRYFDGQKGKRLFPYKGGDPVCTGCRSRRDRAKARCQSTMTHDMIQHRCELEEHTTGTHRGDGYEWTAMGRIVKVVA